MSDTTLTTDDTIQKIAQQAPAVADEHAALEAAAAESDTAEAALLASVIEAVRPALRALASRVLVGEVTHGAGSHLCRTSKTYASWRGVLVAGDDEAEDDDSRQNDGAYEGTGLYLDTEGILREVSWSGHWSRWQGSTRRAEGAERRVTPYSVVQEWQAGTVATIVESLSRALAAQNGTRGKATKAATERASRFRALAALLGK